MHQSELTEGPSRGEVGWQHQSDLADDHRLLVWPSRRMQGQMKLTLRGSDPERRYKINTAREREMQVA
jgi:hypothetical protein